MNQIKIREMLKLQLERKKQFFEVSKKEMPLLIKEGKLQTLSRETALLLEDCFVRTYYLGRDEIQLFFNGISSTPPYKDIVSYILEKEKEVYYQILTDEMVDFLRTELYDESLIKEAIKELDK